MVNRLSDLKIYKIIKFVYHFPIYKSRIIFSPPYPCGYG